MKETSEVFKVERRLINNRWHSVHVSADRRVTVDTGEDDQLPDHDGEHFFKPICVAQMICGRVYTYHWYCGFCTKRIGSLGEKKACCPRCGRGIAHYIFAMGVERFDGDMPDEWAAQGEQKSRLDDATGAHE